MTNTKKTKTKDIQPIVVDDKELYVAYHNHAYFDEMQRLLLAYMNKHPAAIEGEPGIGKNHAINEIAKITEKPVYRIRCTEEMTARDIIGGERLEAEKSETGSLATKTVYAPGKLYSGMKEGALVVLDEFNQLNPTVQKALNSALEDVRTLGYVDGTDDVAAKNGFGLFITYNPSTGVTHDDLEPAVRDRCKVFYFEDKPKELKLRIALLRSGRYSVDEILQDGLSMRGVYRDGDDYRFTEKKDGVWYAYGSDTVLDEKPIHPYLFFDKSKIRPLDFNDEKKQEYYQVGKGIVNSLDEIKALREYGTKYARESLGLKVDEISRLNVITPSQRLVIKLVEDYIKLRDLGYSSGQALGDIADSMVDATVPAAQRDMKIGKDMTISQLIRSIGAANGIIDRSGLVDLKSRLSRDTKEKMVIDLMEKGYIKSVAERLVNEYTN
jgi:hypothetical protein